MKQPRRQGAALRRSSPCWTDANVEDLVRQLAPAIIKLRRGAHAFGCATAAAARLPTRNDTANAEVLSGWYEIRSQEPTCAPLATHGFRTDFSFDLYDLDDLGADDLIFSNRREVIIPPLTTRRSSQTAHRSFNGATIEYYFRQLSPKYCRSARRWIPTRPLPELPGAISPPASS